MRRQQAGRSESTGTRTAIPNAPAELLLYAGQAIVLLKVVLVVLLFDPRAADTFSLPKSAASHALSGFLLVVVLGYLMATRFRSLPWTPIHISVAALVVAFAAAVPFAADQTVALYGAARRYLGLTHMVDMAILYCAAVLFFRERRALERLLVVVLVSSLPVDLYAFVQFSGLDPISYLQGSTRTAISTLGQPDVLSGYAGIVAATCAGVLFLEWTSMSRMSRSMVALVGVLASIVLFGNGARAGLLALAGAAIALLLVSLIRGVALRRVLGTAAVGAAVGLMAILASPMRSRLSWDAVGASLEARSDIWQTAVDAVRTHVLLGVGPDNFVAVYPSLHSQRSVALQNNLLQNSTHDSLLYFATSAGVIGVTLFVALTALVAYSGFKLARARDVGGLALVPLLAYLGQSLVNVNDIALDSLFWLSAGVIAARSASEWLPRRSAGRADWGSALVLGALLLLVAGGAAVAQTHRVAASEAVSATNALISAGRGLDAVQEGRRAIAEDDKRAEMWASFASAIASAGNPGAAETAFRDALARAPWQPLYWRNITILRLQRGDLPGAQDALKRGLGADPWDSEAHDLLAHLSFNEGNYDEAAQHGAITVVLVPQRGTAYEVPVKALIALGRISEADRIVQQGIARPDVVEPRMLQVLRGEVLAAQGHRPEARLQVDEVLRSYPDYAPALSLLRRLSGP